MKYKVLVAEDDGDIRSLLELYLKSEGFVPILTDNGKDALTILRREHIDLALLDVMMPGMDGLALTREIRAVSNIPIILLSARDQDWDKILGLNLGADDYLTKPFNPLEVMAHIQSALRRFYKLGSGMTEGGGPQRLALGELVLDLNGMRLEKNGRIIELTPMEYRILLKLMQQPGRVYTKAQLYDSAAGGFTENDEKTIMVHISKLREKIEEDSKNPRYIKTIRGLGYKIEYKDKN